MVFAGPSILIRTVHRVMVRLLTIEVKVVLIAEVANTWLGHKASLNVVKRDRFTGSRTRVSYNSYNYN